MNGKSILITGANGGLGFETAKLLTAKGFDRILLAGRSLGKVQQAKSELDGLASAGTVISAAGGFDMNDPESIQNAVLALPHNEKFDVVFLQAGGVVFKDDYQYVTYNHTKVERTLFQNAIGGYITLINLMKNGLLAENARVVFAGGEGARGIPGMIEKPEFRSAKDFMNYVSGTGKQPAYNPMNAIGVSKLVSALIVQKLARSGDGNKYVWFTPGFTHGTQGLAAMPAVKRFVMEKVMFGISGLLGFSQSPKQGAEKFAASLLGLIGSNGDVLGAPEGKVLGEITDQKPMNPTLTDQTIIDEFWDLLQSIYPIPQIETQTI